MGKVDATAGTCIIKDCTKTASGDATIHVPADLGGFTVLSSGGPYTVRMCAQHLAVVGSGSNALRGLSIGDHPVQRPWPGKS